jgi:VanZ family protein
MSAAAPGIVNRYFVSAALYYGLLSIVSHIPGPLLSRLAFDIWDKAIHFAIYSVLGILIYLGIRKAFGRLDPLPAVFLSGLAALGLGALDETHQLFVAGRMASVGDGVADFLGGLVGALLTEATCRWRPRGQKQTTPPRLDEAPPREESRIPK